MPRRTIGSFGCDKENNYIGGGGAIRSSQYKETAERVIDQESEILVDFIRQRRMKFGN